MNGDLVASHVLCLEDFGEPICTAADDEKCRLQFLLLEVV